IATGFEHKDPFAKPTEVKKAEPRPEKIVMTLGMDTEEPKPMQQLVQQTLPLEDHDPFAPRMQAVPIPEPVLNLFSPVVAPEQAAEPAVEEEKESMVLHFELSPELPAEVTEQPVQPAKPAVSYLSKPCNIYAAEEPVGKTVAPVTLTQPEPELVQEEAQMEMQLVER
ncbi:hypothetical protein GUJ74_24305, partial|uniref:hypothetical protein n=1 Tax=Escherichia coli TaxID=562 RepID=UPI0016910D4A|nr:hypothetical protein [Escherichia coli]